MTLGLTTLALGFAIAALASIPALIENRVVGDIVVVVGLAVAFAGAVLVLTAIPGAQALRRDRQRSIDAQVAVLRVRRERILEDQLMLQANLIELDAKAIGGTGRAKFGGMLGNGSTPEYKKAKDDLKREFYNLRAELAVNTVELKALGVELGAEDFVL